MAPEPDPRITAFTDTAEKLLKGESASTEEIKNVTAVIVKSASFLGGEMVQKAEKIIEIIQEQAVEWEAGKSGDIVKILQIISLLAEMVSPDIEGANNAKMMFMKEILLGLIDGIQKFNSKQCDLSKIMEPLEKPIQALIDNKAGEMIVKISMSAARIMDLIMLSFDPQQKIIAALDILSSTNFNTKSESNGDNFNVTESLSGPLKVVGQAFRVGAVLGNRVLQKQGRKHIQKPDDIKENLEELQDPEAILELTRDILTEITSMGDEQNKMNKFIFASMKILNFVNQQVADQMEDPLSKISPKDITKTAGQVVSKFFPNVAFIVEILEDYITQIENFIENTDDTVKNKLRSIMDTSSKQRDLTRELQIQAIFDVFNPIIVGIFDTPEELVNATINIVCGT